MHVFWVDVAARGPAYVLPPEILAKARALARRETVLYVASLLWTLLVYGLLLRFRFGAWLSGWATAWTARRGAFAERPVLAGWVMAPVMLLLLAIAGLPGRVYGHHLSREFGLSVERWPAWWWDWVLATVGTLLVGTLVVQVVFALLRRSGRRWWVWFWVLVQPLLVAGTYLTPLVIDPIFNHFTPLSATDPGLVAKLEKLAAMGGLDIPPSRIFLEDASRRATTPNAYVTGIGPSKRIVVWDTTLKQVPQDETLAIYAHEQGHYVLGHIWQGLIFASLLILLLLWILDGALRGAVRRFGGRWHIAREDAWAALPLVFFLAFALEFLSSPVACAWSRMDEHAADVYGQKLLERVTPNAAETEVRLFNRLGRSALDVPDPSRWMVWWTYTHPPLSERAADAQRMGGTMNQEKMDQ